MELQKSGSLWTVCLNRNEEIISNLTELALREAIPFATILGVGAVKNTELGYFDLEKKDYLRRLFEEDAELISLNGNITWVDSKPYVHIHLCLSGPDFKAYAGHCFKATIAVAGEVVLQMGTHQVNRKRADFCGLNLWSL